NAPDRAARPRPASPGRALTLAHCTKGVKIGRRSGVNFARRLTNGWVYTGAVGTGFNSKEAASLRSALDKLRTNKPVVPLKGKNLVFAQPMLIAEIEFRGWSNDGKLRHASYKGLRDVQDNVAVFNMNDGET
ncbi:hypothetical protein ACH196_33770, partial [Mesorhizobium sp. IMUNJ23232]